MNIEERTKLIENLVVEGMNETNEFARILGKVIDFGEFSLNEATINGKYYNRELGASIEKFSQIVQSLRNHLVKKDALDLNLDLMQGMIEVTRHNRSGMIMTLGLIVKDKHIDDADKETAHKRVAMFDQLVSEYDNLVFQLSLKNVNLRTLKQSGKIDIEKIGLKHNYSADEIIEFLEEFKNYTAH